MPGEQKEGGESKSSDGAARDFAEGKSSGTANFTSTEGKANDAELDIIKRATKYCFSDDFIGIFERYIRDNAYIFKDAVSRNMTEAEHKLEYMDSFKDYLIVFEDAMHDWLEEEGITFREFQEQLTTAKVDGSQADKYFVKLLMASGEYDCYYDVMVKEAIKQFGPDGH